MHYKVRVKTAATTFSIALQRFFNTLCFSTPCGADVDNEQYSELHNGSQTYCFRLD